jgi:hypothetical protein
LCDRREHPHHFPISQRTLLCKQAEDRRLPLTADPLQRRFGRVVNRLFGALVIRIHLVILVCYDQLPPLSYLFGNYITEKCVLF